MLPRSAVWSTPTMPFEEILLELAIIERLALAAVLQRIASRQLGEAFESLETETPAQD